MAGVEAVGTAGHCGRRADWGVAEDGALVSLPYPGAQTPGDPGSLAPLPGLALVVEALTRALPDTSETQRFGQIRARGGKGGGGRTWCRRGLAG